MRAKLITYNFGKVGGIWLFEWTAEGWGSDDYYAYEAWERMTYGGVKCMEP